MTLTACDNGRKMRETEKMQDRRESTRKGEKCEKEKREIGSGSYIGITLSIILEKLWNRL